MAEYIDRGELTIWLNKKSCEFSMNDVAPIGWTLCGLVNELTTFPSADVVERKTGRWMPIKEETGVEAFGFKEMAVDAFCCSACGKEVDVSEGDFKFCPNCGAKMEAEPPKEEA